MSDAIQTAEDSPNPRRPPSRVSRSSARSSRDVSPMSPAMDLSQLSEEERMAILAVNARADADSLQSSRRTSMSESSIIDEMELSGLTDEERMQIHNVMLRAAELEHAAQLEPISSVLTPEENGKRTSSRYSPAMSTSSLLEDEPVLVQMDSLPESNVKFYLPVEDSQRL